MKLIHLKYYYPFLEEDIAIEVPDEIAAILSIGGHHGEDYKRIKRRTGETSLDIMRDIPGLSPTPLEIIERREKAAALYDALTKLPPAQGRRIYAHFILGKSMTDIAADEGVSKGRVSRSIHCGLCRLRKFLKSSI